MSSRDDQFSDYEPLSHSRPKRRRASEGDAETNWQSRTVDNPSKPPAVSAAASALPETDDGTSTQSERLRGDEPPPQATPHKAAKDARRERGRAVWLARRGHAVSFAGLFVFTIVLYFRPYEFIPALSSFTTMAFWVAFLTLVAFIPAQLSIEGNLTARPREVNLVLLLVLAALLSMPLAIDPAKSWETFNETFIKAVLMFIVMVNVTRTERRLRWLLFLGLAVCAVLSVGALDDYRSGNLTLDGYRISGRIGGLFGNPNELALNLLLMVPIVLALMLSTRRAFAKLLYLACALLMMTSIILTFSRGSFLGLAAMAVVLAWKIRRRNRLFVAVFILGALLMLVALVPGGYAERLASIVDHSRDTLGSASQRQNLLFLSIKVALRHPLLGVGMGNFVIVSVRGLVTHNGYTQVAAEMGLPALVVFWLFLTSPYKRLRQIEQETRESRADARFYYLAVGLQASIVGFMVNLFFISSAYQWYTFYLVGYAVCLRRVYQTAKGLTEDTVIEVAKRKRGRISEGLTPEPSHARVGAVAAGEP